MKNVHIFSYKYNSFIVLLDCFRGLFNLIDDIKGKKDVNSFCGNVFDRTASEKYPNAKVLTVPDSPTGFEIRKKNINNLKLQEERFAIQNASISKNAKISDYILIGSIFILHVIPQKHHE